MLPNLSAARSLVFRFLCKIWVGLCYLYTQTKRVGKTDPTQILLDEQTPPQIAAYTNIYADQSVRRKNPTKLLVIVPFRDRWQLTQRCIASILTQTLEAGSRFNGLSSLSIRVVLLDNGSQAAETSDGIQAILAKTMHGHTQENTSGLHFVHLRIDAPFNFSRLNNQAVAANKDFSPELILFLNNDIEFKQSDDLLQLADFAVSCPQLGAVGCSLFYPSGAVQHLFLAPGVKIVAAHPLKGKMLSNKAAWFAAPRPVAAVTGAVLLVSASAYARASGFNEDLPTVGQDVDLCLRLQKHGLCNWVLPHVHAVHHEGATRGGSIDKAQVRLMYQIWGEQLKQNAYLSRRFSRYSEHPVLKPAWEPAYPWWLVLP